MSLGKTIKGVYLHQIPHILRSEHHRRNQNNRIDHQHKVVDEKFEKVPKLMRRFVENGHQYDATDEENFIIASHRCFSTARIFVTSGNGNTPMKKSFKTHYFDHLFRSNSHIQVSTTLNYSHPHTVLYSN